MFAQINFTISPESEKRLFSFITNECGCNIFTAESANGDFLLKNDMKIDSDKYLISPLPADFPFKPEKRQSNYSSSEVWVIYPFDENIEFLPFIEYERDLFSESGDTPCRLCMRTSSISARFRNEMKSIYRKIKIWIKNNAEKKIISGIISIYKIK